MGTIDTAGILARADLGCFEVDMETRAVSVDRRGGELLGLREGEGTLDDLLAALDDADRERVAGRLRAAASSEGDTYHEELRTRSRRWIAADGRAELDPGRRRVIVAGVLR